MGFPPLQAGVRAHPQAEEFPSWQRGRGWGGAMRRLTASQRPGSVCSQLVPSGSDMNRRPCSEKGLSLCPCLPVHVGYFDFLAQPRALREGSCCPRSWTAVPYRATGISGLVGGRGPLCPGEAGLPPAHLLSRVPGTARSSVSDAGLSFPVPSTSAWHLPPESR